MRNQGQLVAGTINTFDSEDTYPTHEDTGGRGGYRVVSTIAERNAIPSSRRKPLMKVAVQATGVEYVLTESGSWIEAENATAADGSILNLRTATAASSFAETGDGGQDQVLWQLDSASFTPVDGDQLTACFILRVSGVGEVVVEISRDGGSTTAEVLTESNLSVVQVKLDLGFYNNNGTIEAASFANASGFAVEASAGAYSDSFQLIASAAAGTNVQLIHVTQAPSASTEA